MCCGSLEAKCVCFEVCDDALHQIRRVGIKAEIAGPLIHIWVVVDGVEELAELAELRWSL